MVDSERAEFGARLVMSVRGDPHHSGRDVRRQRILAMRPVDPAVSIVPSPPRTWRGGVLWEYLQADDSPLFLRAVDLADSEDARWDATQIFDLGRRLQIVYVRELDTGELSWWLVRGREIVLVAPRVWATANRAAVVRHVRRALRVLRVLPPWGTYSH